MDTSALLAKDVYTNQHQYMILQNPPPFHRYHVIAQHINYCAVLITLLHLAYVRTIIHMAQYGLVELQKKRPSHLILVRR
jgi:hypothetical protein